MPLIVNAIPERRLHQSVIHQKCGHSNSAALINHALAHIFRRQYRSLSVQFFVEVSAHMHVEGIRLFQMFHHLDGSRGTPHSQRVIRPMIQPVSQRSGTPTT